MAGERVSVVLEVAEVNVERVPMTPEYPPALSARLQSGGVVLLAAPPGVAVNETWTPGEPETSTVVTTANPMRLWFQTEAEAVWYVKDGGWVPFPCPPCILTLGEVAHIVWGLKPPFADEMSRYGALCSWTARNDDEEAEVHALSKVLEAAGLHPGWPIVPREVRDDGT